MIWIFVIIAITINGINTINDSNFHQFFYSLDLVPYGHYIVKKWFLVIVALLTFIYWLTKKKDLFKNIKSNLLSSFFIGLALLAARFQSFQGWFWHDDYREMGYYYTNSNLVEFTYPLGIFFLVVRWFNLNFALYNGLGLVFYFLSGIFIYLISNQIQKRKYVSLLAALFFVTSPAYFQEWFLMINFIGNAFVLLLFLISFYLLLKNFLPGALIFAAAALEFGIVRTHFIPFYLILAGLLFTSNKLFSKRHLLNFLIKLSPFLIIFLIYMHYSLANLSFSSGNVILDFNHYLNYFFTIGNMLGEIAIPFFIFAPLMKLLGLIFNNWPYIPVVIGYLIVLILMFFTLFLFLFKKKVYVSKIFFLSLFIFVSAVIVPSLIGRRVSHTVEKFLEHNQTAPYPTVTTAYSIFSVFGLTLFFIGLGNIANPRMYKVGMLILIILNILTYIQSDRIWIQNYAYPQRKENSQLIALLAEAKPLYIYVVPSTDPLMKHYQRHLWQGIRNFQLAFRPNQKINIYMYTKDFEDAIKKDQPSPTKIYYLQEDISYSIQNLSDKFRRNDSNDSE